MTSCVDHALLMFRCARTHHLDRPLLLQYHCLLRMLIAGYWKLTHDLSSRGRRGRGSEPLPIPPIAMEIVAYLVLAGNNSATAGVRPQSFVPKALRSPDGEIDVTDMDTAKSEGMGYLDTGMEFFEG